MLTREWEKLRYHPEQAKLWRTNARFVAVCAGRGSGKTLLAKRRVIRMLPVRKPWRDPKYFYAMPTREWGKRVAWEDLKALIPPDWIGKNAFNETQLVITTKFGSTLHLLGMDKPSRAEGVQYDGGVIDESSDQKPSVFETSILPTLSHRNAWCWRIGVPKRFGVGAESFKNFFDKGLKGESLVSDDPTLRVESYTWSSEDIVNPSIIAFAKANLDLRDFNEQYRASWEDSAGRIFYAFSDVFNVSNDIVYDPRRPLIIGSDFNVDPMAWVICQQAGERNEHLKAIDELWIRNTSTQAALDQLFVKYREHKAGFVFIGDASGKARKTAASAAAQSDYIIIQNDMRFQPKELNYRKSNPSLADRFASCNAMFCNANNERRFTVHPRCKNLVKDLNGRAYIPGTREADDSGDVGHITDALGYVIFQLYPLRMVITEVPKAGFIF